ncbi:hypothetical protein [Legionella tunisiensis]|uniref:hypothetical protein n=1 Tax=Legionella tunisiensis TaxID=1034944 RepID=UPI0012EA47FA|nr:hypothetical protein [Legionella tunisiensis]
MKITKMISLMVTSLMLYACAPQTETPSTLTNTLSGQADYSNTVDTINNGNETINNSANATTNAAMTTTVVATASMAITDCVVN